MDVTTILTQLAPVLVPISVSLLHMIGKQINDNWPRYLMPFKALIVGWVMTAIAKKTGVHLPTDLTSVDNQTVSAILMSGTIVGAVGIGLREVYDQGKTLVAQLLTKVNQDGSTGKPS